MIESFVWLFVWQSFLLFWPGIVLLPAMPVLLPWLLFKSLRERRAR